MKTVTKARLLELVCAVRDERDAWWQKRDQALAAARRRLAEEGARFTRRGADGHAISLAGIRSSSTSGWAGAFGNWIRAAEKRLASQAGAQ